MLFVVTEALLTVQEMKCEEGPADNQIEIYDGCTPRCIWFTGQIYLHTEYRRLFQVSTDVCAMLKTENGAHDIPVKLLEGFWHF